MMFGLVVRWPNKCYGDEYYFEFEKKVITTTEYLQEASARLDLDAACGLL